MPDLNKLLENLNHHCRVLLFHSSLKNEATSHLVWLKVELFHSVVQLKDLGEVSSVPEHLNEFLECEYVVGNPVLVEER